jgi:hypothetical protein
LILVGVVLVADGFGANIPRVYIYVAMGFAGLVEALNIWAKNGGGHQRAGAQSPKAARPAPQQTRPPVAVFTAQDRSREKTAARRATAKPGKKAGRKRGRRK